MSENSLSETYLSETYGMVYFIQPGDTPEYLEDLRKRGFITVSFEPYESLENEKEYANIVVTAADTTDPNNWADGPAKQVTFIDSMTDTTNCSVTINNSNTTNTTTDPNNWADGPSYPVNWPESTDTTQQVYKLVLVDGEPLKLVPNNLPTGDVMDEGEKAFLNQILEKARTRNSNPIAFINSIDSETAAVTSVQVACADTDGWRTVGVLNNPDGIDWKYQAGNLTGSGAASVVWHAQELGALGVWTDGTDNWTGIAGWFDENWTMLGCGDFDGDGKDSVLMSLNGGLFYSVDLDGTLTSLGGLNWSGWEFGAVGDFAGDGKDDVVLFHRESGAVVLLADGNADNYKSIGQLDASDWSVAGVRDFNGDGIDDLLVRQNSTGIAGAYAGGDMNRWSVVDTSADYYLA